MEEKLQIAIEALEEIIKKFNELSDYPQIRYSGLDKIASEALEKVKTIDSRFGGENMVGKQVKIIKTFHPLNWWVGCVGQLCPVLELYEPTGMIKIRVMRQEYDFEPYPVEGWIDPQYVEEI